MNFGEAVKSGFQNYVNFEGVARRSEFWWFFLFNFLAGIVAQILDTLIFGASANGSTPFPLFSLIVSLGLLLPYLAVAIRRFRDAGYRWYNIFWAFLPLAGPIILIVLWTRPSVIRPETVNGYTTV